MIVYCITNKINGKRYIGSDSNDNPKYYGSGVYIKKAIKKYGKGNFHKETLCRTNDIEMMKNLEEYFINFTNAYLSPLFYNATKYSVGVSKCTWKNSISEKNKGNKYNLGKSHSQETKDKISNSNRGNTHTDYFKELKRKKAIGNTYALGNKLTKEQKEKISHSKINHPCYLDPKRNEKIREKNSKPVLQYNMKGEFIREHKSQTEACIYIGAKGMAHALKDFNKSCKGFRFKLKNPQ